MQNIGGPWTAELVRRDGFESKETSNAANQSATLEERLASLATRDPGVFLERYGIPFWEFVDVSVFV